MKNKNIKLSDPTKDPFIPNVVSMGKSNTSNFAAYVQQATL